MAILTTGRNEPPCKDNVGGIKRIFIFPFVDYSYTQIVGTRGVNLTSFPATDIYEFAIVNGTFREEIENDEEGLSYKQNVSFTLKKQDKMTTYDLATMEKGELRYIVEFNKGDYKIGGLFNGATLSFDITSGNAKSDLNGYNIKMESTEEWQAAFISDLSSAGFTVIDILLLADGDPFLTEAGEYINLV